MKVDLIEKLLCKGAHNLELVIYPDGLVHAYCRDCPFQMEVDFSKLEKDLRDDR